MLLTEWNTKIVWEYGVDPVIQFKVESEEDVDGGSWKVEFVLDFVHAAAREIGVSDYSVPLKKGVNELSIPCTAWKQFLKHPWTLLQSAALVVVTFSRPTTTPVSVSCVARFLPQADSAVMMIEAPIAAGRSMPFDAVDIATA